MSELYNMKLHNIICPNGRNGGLKILRVPGGWIYYRFDITNKLISSIFVPFDNEFQEQKP